MKILHSGTDFKSNRIFNLMMHTPSKNQGFTLLEISIVLLIIGLIAGGIIASISLINTSEIRGTISQKLQFDTAAQTFKIKYGYLPGDIPPAQAAAFGLFQLDETCGSVCDPNHFNNEKIDYSEGANSVLEPWVFWRHLSESNLIQGAYGSDPSNPLDTANGNPTSFTGTWVPLFQPKAKLDNYYWQINISDSTGWTAWSAVFQLYTPAYDPYVSANHVHALDSKMDDGLPYTGNVVVNWSSSWDAAATSGNCLYAGGGYNDVDSRYNLLAGGELRTCIMFIKPGF